MIILSIVGIVLGLVLLELAVVGFSPLLKAARQPLAAQKDTEDQHQEPVIPQEDVSFEVDSLALGAWYFRPEEEDVPVPCIVMTLPLLHASM